MNLLLEVNPNQKLDFLDALGFGGQTVLIGMATIFSVLIIIWAALAILKIFLHDIPNSKKAKSSALATEPIQTTPIAIEPNDSEVVAVIAAAIAMAENDNDGVKFKVVSFRRK